MALLLAGSMAIGMTGCSDTSWAAECDGMRMPAGVYINNVIGAYTEAVSSLSSNANPDNLWKNTVDGTDIHVWIGSRTQQNVRSYFAVEKKFEEMGLTMDDATRSEAEATAEMQWSYYQSLYEDNGISWESFRTSIVNSYKSNMIFEAIYGEGGSEEVSEQDLLKTFNDEYASIDAIFFTLTANSEGTAATQESIDAAAVKAEDYRVRLLNGENIGKLAKEYSDEQAAAAGEEVTDEAVSTSALIPYEGSGYPDSFISAIKSAPKGIPTVVSEDTYVCLVVVNDVTIDSDEFLENEAYVLYQMKQEEYEARVIEWANVLDVTFNEDAVKRYDIKKLKF